MFGKNQNQTITNLERVTLHLHQQIKTLDADNQYLRTKIAKLEADALRTTIVTFSNGEERSLIGRGCVTLNDDWLTVTVANGDEVHAPAESVARVTVRKLVPDLTPAARLG